jgi:hypothetical protein
MPPARCCPPVSTTHALRPPRVSCLMCFTPFRCTLRPLSSGLNQLQTWRGWQHLYSVGRSNLVGDIGAWFGQDDAVHVGVGKGRIGCADEVHCIWSSWKHVRMACLLAPPAASPQKPSIPDSRLAPLVKPIQGVGNNRDQHDCGRHVRTHSMQVDAHPHAGWLRRHGRVSFIVNPRHLSP